MVNVHWNSEDPEHYSKYFYNLLQERKPVIFFLQNLPHKISVHIESRRHYRTAHWDRKMREDIFPETNVHSHNVQAATCQTNELQSKAAIIKFRMWCMCVWFDFNLQNYSSIQSPYNSRIQHTKKKTSYFLCPYSFDNHIGMV